MKSGLWLVLLSLACAVCTACGSDEPATETHRYLVLGQVPTHPDPPVYPWPESGGRVVLVDLMSPSLPPVVLSENLEAAGRPCVRHDGKRVCFVAREKSLKRWSIYACDLDGSNRVRITSMSEPCRSPAWLPDGRIVFSAVVEWGPNKEYAASALHVAPAEGGPSLRITFSGMSEDDPSVLRDGRIVYVGSLGSPDADPRTHKSALFTVHPDGSGVALLHTGRDGALLGGPRQGPDGNIYSVAKMGEVDFGSLTITDWRAPLEASRIVGAARRVGRVEPAGDGSLLLVKPERDRGITTLARTSADGTAVEDGLFADPDWMVVDVADASPRRKPQGHLSTIDIRKETGRLLAIGTDGEGVQGAVAARLKQWVREFDDEPAVLESLGQVPLEEDGSFFVRVPADVPLKVELLDKDGEVLHASCTPFWVRPNEIRGCTGCHDPSDVVPPNRRPLAVLKDPVALRGDD